MEEFDFLVVGNEPAGLWLARRLSEDLAGESPVPRIGWVDLGAPPRSFFPDKLSSLFQLPAAEEKDVFAPEIVTPDRTLTWSESRLTEVFPELPTSLLNDLAPKFPLTLSPATKSALRFCLRAHPELLPLSAGLWKRLGRAPELHPETILAASLLCTQLRTWNPAQELPSSVEVFRLNAGTHPLQGFKTSKAGELSLQFTGLPPLMAKKWILNVPFHVLTQITAGFPEFEALLHGTTAMRSHLGLFGLDLKVKPQALPANLRRLTVVLETESIPDPDEEMWPLELEAGPDELALTLWASAPQDISLEATLDQFRKGMGKLNRLFPFLSESITAVSLPLGMESCFDESARTEAYEQLSHRHWETYQAVSFQTRSRSPSLDTFFPYLNCHLPYPVGPLCAAHDWLTDVVRRRKKRKKAPSATPSDTAANP